jgi:hypothetical protein
MHHRHAGALAPGSVAGPLSHLVEQLWAPALDTGQVRMVLGTPPQDGWASAETYLVAPTLDRATMLLPAGPRAATRGALLNYRGLRRRLPNAQRTVLGGASALGVRLPFPRLTLQLADGAGENRALLPLGMLSAHLGAEPLFASIGIRTGANRKATLQLVDGAGRPAGFAKFAWNPSSSAGIRRETAALAGAAQHGAARSPGLLASGDFHGHPFLVSSPLPLTTRGVRDDVPPPTPAELAALTPVTRWGRAGHTEQLGALRERLAALPGGPGTDAVRERACGLLAEVAERETVHPVTRRWHGDLTPWNSARDDDGVLWCWDWESSEPDALAGMDALHWYVTVRTERGEALDGTLLRSAYHQAGSHLVAVGTPRRGWSEVLAVYAATLAERACELAATGGWEEGWVLPHQLLDLLDTSARAMEES